MDQIVSADPAPSAPVQAAPIVEAPLTFIRRQDEKPVFHSAALTGGAVKLFFETEDHTVPIGDMRAIAEDLSLDREGFELLRCPTAAEDLHDDAAVEQVYYPEIKALLRERLGADRVVVFDATRRADSDVGAKNPDGLRGPAARVHVDYTVGSGPQRVADILGEDEFARLQASGARIVQINVWRPIRGPVERSPLALADASSVRADDLIATDQVFADRVGEIYHLAHDPAQRWYFAPRMTTDEVILIKGWDSLDDGRARFTPHGAFQLPDTPASAPPRESIEVRTLVVIE
ncbi:MAG TPA: CmcJ/NvfI family oxidoreductase [Alphaproteobacteria bacterium]|nr:CmcJ/NvfI family oxidoreductase [Alphaproteobacteria bacterium]